jgi:hypothetical protein
LARELKGEKGMSSKAVNGWLPRLLPVLLALCAPLAVAAQEGDPYTLEAIGSANGVLKAQWMDLRVEQVEVLSVGQAYASTRVHRQPFRWVSGDARRAADGSRLTYLVRGTPERAASGLSAGDAETAISHAMAAWSSDVCLGKVGLVKRPDMGQDPDIFDAQLGFGEPGDWRAADVVLGGWMPPEFFDAVVPAGGRTVLALSVTFVFVGPDGQPTDVDRDGSIDTAANEIYFNEGFDWSVDGTHGFDVRTVALHEIGHSLGLVHVAPPYAAVMSPVYTGTLSELTPRDHAALCSIWSSWPR